MLLMVQKGIRGGKCHAIHRQANANDKYIKDHDKNKESLSLKYWDVNNSYGSEMLQKLPANNFKWIEDTSQINDDFIKSCNEENNEGYFLEADVQYVEKLHKLHNDLPLLLGRMNIKSRNASG